MEPTTDTSVVDFDFLIPEQGETFVLAQGIVCKPWALAFSFDWTYTIAEDTEVTIVPRAPNWLRGAINFEGEVLPVIDLAVYFSPTDAAPERQRGERLLLGGLRRGEQNSVETAMAIVFSQRPQQLRYERTPVAYLSALPPKLRELAMAQATLADGTTYIEIDTAKLLDALGGELAAM